MHRLFQRAEGHGSLPSLLKPLYNDHRETCDYAKLGFLIMLKKRSFIMTQSLQWLQREKLVGFCDRMVLVEKLVSKFWARIGQN